MAARKGSFGVRLNVPGAPHCPIRVADWPGDALQPGVTYPLSDLGLMEAQVRDWISAHTPAKTTEFVVDGQPTGRHYPVNSTCPIQLVPLDAAEEVTQDG